MNGIIDWDPRRAHDKARKEAEMERLRPPEAFEGPAPRDWCEGELREDPPPNLRHTTALVVAFAAAAAAFLWR